ncbi:HlyD family secretion protein [Pseudomonas vanderleydeniana]|uniref:HlyD family efflux transporter periplasmic adaptor subunit n=1 Tax=Pseudomonas vanderleydeniana TaxID=2745495 RepID=A0A9E6TQK9_9PSED|nr:HlyD family efflux transporter periplasmic adaptor subunit [Pseudomonas vanderleydeniana]QXI26606.1 HlyD family efflux transporter periplasmic adaptor subunit [Pseudomonas vanderleydeniana]
MNLYSLRPWLLLSGVLLLLTGCPRNEPPPRPDAAASPYVAVARGRVDVEGGLLKLGVSRDGVVARVQVKEGDRVSKGQLLATLDSELANLAVAAAQGEQQQVRLQARQLDRRLHLAEQKARRLAKAAAAGAGDSQSAEDAREIAEQLRDEVHKSRIDADTAARKLATARYELAQRQLRAPVDGHVVRRLIQPGTTVSAQSGPSFILLPAGARIVRAELNESFAGVVAAGMKAEVTDEGGGRLAPLSAHVVRIGEVLGASTLEDDPAVRANLRTVECILAFDSPEPASLRVGQRLLVRFTPQ